MTASPTAERASHQRGPHALLLVARDGRRVEVDRFGHGHVKIRKSRVQPVFDRFQDGRSQCARTPQRIFSSDPLERIFRPEALVRPRPDPIIPPSLHTARRCPPLRVHERPGNARGSRLCTATRIVQRDATLETARRTETNVQRDATLRRPVDLKWR